MKKALGLLVGTFLLGTSTNVVAATFAYSGATVNQGGTVNITAPNSTGNVNAGQIQLNALIGADILAWCIDIFGTLAQVDVMNTSALGLTGSGSPNPFLSTGQISQMGSLMIQGDALMAGAHAAETSAAIQLSIWRVEYTNLAFTTSAAIKALSDTFLAYVAIGGLWDCPTCGVTKMVGTYPDKNQVLGTGVIGEPLSQVPVPPAVILFASGLAGIGALTWRKRRKAEQQTS
jgi:hypothetical protein